MTRSSVSTYLRDWHRNKDKLDRRSTWSELAKLSGYLERFPRDLDDHDESVDPEKV